MHELTDARVLLGLTDVRQHVYIYIHNLYILFLIAIQHKYISQLVSLMIHNNAVTPRLFLLDFVSSFFSHL